MNEKSPDNTGLLTIIWSRSRISDLSDNQIDMKSHRQSFG